MLAGLWRYRSFVLGMARREFEARYRGSALGTVWAIASPLAMIFIYTVVFGHMMRARLSGVDDPLAYGIFLCAGVLTWNMFAEILQRCVNVFVDQGNLLKKMSFPRATLPAIVVVSGIVNFAIVLGILLVVLVLVGRFPGWPLVAFVPLLALHLSFALGAGVALGVVNVFFRDVAHALAVTLQFWFWFTPIVYPLDLVGEPVRSVIALNPLTGLTLGYQAILVHGQWPVWSALVSPLAVSLFTLWLARYTFRTLAGEMADHL
jgi:homopolymeric O-antigen transport system permease protein